MTTREKFEARCRQLGRTFEWHPLMKFYSPSEIDSLWDEWQASRTEALEESIQALEMERGIVRGSMDQYNSRDYTERLDAKDDAIGDCLDAIRSLSKDRP